MRRVKSPWALVLVLLAVILGVGVSTQEAVRHADKFAPFRAVCELRVPGGQGSGTMIAVSGDKCLVLSCRHVCEQEGTLVTVNWRWAGNQTTYGRVVKVMRGGGFDTDQALIVCGRPKGVKAVKIATFDQDEGPFVCAGYRDNYMRIVCAEATYVDDLIVVHSPAVRGMSGGALFNRYGQVVGIVVASDFTTHTLCANGPAMRQMIAEFRKPAAGQL